MPRAGLNGDDVVAAAAGLADEIGFHAVTMGLLADRLGIRPPSLYKHVGGLADLQHRIATLAMTEFGDVIRDAVQGTAGLDALTAALTAARATSPRTRAATRPRSAPSSPGPATRCWPRAPASSTRSPPCCAGTASARIEMDHAIRTIRCTMHGFAMLEASRGFQWNADPDESFDWMIRFIDRGLRH